MNDWRKKSAVGCKGRNMSSAVAATGPGSAGPTCV